MKECFKCNRKYIATSRHKKCPACRRRDYRDKCLCGNLKQRHSFQCRECYLKLKTEISRSKKFKTKNGYIYIKRKEHPYADKMGRVLEHRIVMEQMIGRCLLINENVHHKNGIKDDNRPENLELWIKPQPTGIKVEDAIKWAKEILKIYGGISVEATR